MLQTPGIKACGLEGCDSKTMAGGKLAKRGRCEEAEMVGVGDRGKAFALQMAQEGVEVRRGEIHQAAALQESEGFAEQIYRRAEMFQHLEGGDDIEATAAQGIRSQGSLNNLNSPFAT